MLVLILEFLAVNAQGKAMLSLVFFREFQFVCQGAEQIEPFAFLTDRTSVKSIKFLLEQTNCSQLR
ncbi:hypothetical protein DHD05_12135 [Arenibacter sp. N53]|nr:hypothetical protein [Arenibacter sp. N53]